MKSKIELLILLFLLILLCEAGCDSIEPPPPPPADTVANTITINVLWTDLNKIALKFTRSSLDSTNTFNYYLKRKDPQGNEVTYSFTLVGEDTTYTDSTNGLQQGTEYRYKTEAKDNTGKLTDTSKTVTAKTLAPTSHNITWTIDTLGQPGNFLNDVWGLDENNVWAVGAVNMPQGVTSVIKWDGTKWNYHSWPEGGASGIWGFSTNDIWVAGEWANRGFLGHYNGSSWSEYNDNYFLSRGDTVYPLRSIWGSAPDDVWAVGDNGTIIHWDGTAWRKIEINLPSDRAFWDVWGTDNNNVYAVTLSLSDQSELFHYDGNQWIEVTAQLPSMERSLTSVWMDKNNTGYLAGNTTIYYNGITWKYIYINQTRFLTRVRGSNQANVFIGGQRGRVHHYNGANWQAYPELYADSGPLNEIRGIQVFDEKVFLV